MEIGAAGWCGNFLLAVIIQLVRCEEDNRVLIRPHADVKYINVPTSSEPLVSWMDVQKGIFPNTTEIKESLKIGEPISVFIYLRDKSHLYDMKVTDCWGYDEHDLSQSKYKLHLISNGTGTANNTFKKSSIMNKWRKFKFPKTSSNAVFLYTDLRSFKFPEKQQIFITCDVELCLNVCKEEQGN